MADAPPIYPNEAAIIAIGERFADRSLAKAEWTHAAHFAACLWLLRFRPDLNAERDMPDMIRRYNEATGGVNSDSAGYHETITQASIRAARAYLLHYRTLPLHAIHGHLMASPCGRKDWLLHHWSRDILMHASARLAWIEPNLYRLPF